MIELIEKDLLRWGYNRQSVWEWDDNIDILSLLQKIEDWYYETKKIKFNIEVYNLATDGFECNNLFDILLHYKLIENADLKYPIIINNHWQVIDWRHRICKAILKWKKEIDAIQIMCDKVI